MKLFKGILHTAEYTEEMARAEDQNYSEEEIQIITEYMQAWDGVRVTLSNFVEGEYSVVGWPPEEEEKVKNAIYLMEQDRMFGQYVDDPERFVADWEAGNWEPSGSIVFSPAMVEIIEENQKDFREVIRGCDLRKQCVQQGKKKPRIKQKKCTGLRMPDGKPLFACSICEGWKGDGNE